MTDAFDLSPQDQKLVVLARATLARTGVAQSAAIRDLDGRTYTAATLSLPSLQISALAGCLSMAASSGAKGLEAAVVLGKQEGELSQPDQDALREFSGLPITVFIGNSSGRIEASRVI